MTDQEFYERLLKIVRELYDFKEAVLFTSPFQPEFEAGQLDAALGILERLLDPDDPDVKRETDRQMASRLSRAIESAERKTGA